MRAAAFLTAIAVGVAVALWLPHTHSVYRVPTACRQAAAATSAHLRALTDGSGTAIKVEVIGADIAHLNACEGSRK